MINDLPIWNYLVLQVESRKYSIHREEAVNAIVDALEGSLTDESVQKTCCTALLTLAEHFSFTGDLSTENWIHEPSRLMDSNDLSACDNEENGLLVNGAVFLVGLISLSLYTSLVSNFFQYFPVLFKCKPFYKFDYFMWEVLRSSSSRRHKIYISLLMLLTG